MISMVLFPGYLSSQFGSLAEGLGIACAFCAARAALGLARYLCGTNCHFQHCRMVTSICMFGSFLAASPWSHYEVWFVFLVCCCTLGLPIEVCWYGKRVRSTNANGGPPSTRAAVYSMAWAMDRAEAAAQQAAEDLGEACVSVECTCP